MASITPPAYKADDRSVLLPYYRRFCVDPFLPFIPAKMKPNTTTSTSVAIWTMPRKRCATRPKLSRRNWGVSANFWLRCRQRSPIKKQRYGVPANRKQRPWKALPLMPPIASSRTWLRTVT